MYLCKYEQSQIISPLFTLMTTSKNTTFAIVGAGLVGSMLSLLLAKKGYNVSVFEKRCDPRHVKEYAGRSINLALSRRGIRTLELTGILDDILKTAVPMKGRLIHDLDGGTNFLPYSKDGKYINSISRGGLNKMLIEEAEKQGAKFIFEAEVTTDNGLLIDGKTVDADIVIGADGAYSKMRSLIPAQDASFELLSHAYKELHISSDEANNFKMEPNALHIWPRGKFLMIALPNGDKSFTATLFLPHTGENSFEKLTSEEEFYAFYEKYFADSLQVLPDLKEQFHLTPVSNLGTVRCTKWTDKNLLLIGDAAHGIIPFYGQGMNAGFEDCFLFMEQLENNSLSVSDFLKNFVDNRLKDAHAIAELSLDNFIEMRDKVADKDFLDAKKIEAVITTILTEEEWIPKYSLVTFSTVPYSVAYEKGKEHDAILYDLVKLHREKEIEIPNEKLIREVIERIVV